MQIGTPVEPTIIVSSQLVKRSIVQGPVSVKNYNPIAAGEFDEHKSLIAQRFGDRDPQVFLIDRARIARRQAMSGWIEIVGAHCAKDYMGTPAGNYALAMARLCVALGEDEQNAVAKAGMLELAAVVRQRGKAGACRWVGEVERDVIRAQKVLSRPNTQIASRVACPLCPLPGRLETNSG